MAPLVAGAAIGVVATGLYYLGAWLGGTLQTIGTAAAVLAVPLVAAMATAAMALHRQDRIRQSRRRRNSA